MDIGLKISNKKIHGINVYHIHAPHALVSYVAYHSLSGSFAEHEKNEGIAHYLEHVFFKGTENRDYEEISQEGALLGAEMNAYTSEYGTAYHLTAPTVNYPQTIELLSDMMFNPTFPEEEIEKERHVIQSERKMYEDSHDSCFYESLEKHVLNYQVGHSVIGTEETISSINRKDIVNYHKNMYGKNNLILLIIGRMTSEEAFSECSKILKNNPLERIKKVKMEKEIVSNLEDCVITRKNIQQSHLAMVFKSPSSEDSDQRYSCFLKCLGGGMFSYLFKVIREEMGLCYSIGSFQFISNKYSGSSLIGTEIDEDDVEICKAKILEVLDDIKEHGFNLTTFKCARATMLANWCRMMETPRKVANGLAKLLLMGLEVDFQKEYDELVNMEYNDFNNYAKEFVSNLEYCWFQMNPEKE